MKTGNVPKLRFKEFNDPWKEKKLGHIATKIGSGSTPKGGSDVYSKQGIPFIRSQNVVNGELLLDETYISEEINNKMKGSIVEANDILLNITGGSIGRTCVVPPDFEKGNVNQHVCIIRLGSDSSKFIESFLSSFKGQKLILEGQTGSGREGLNFQSIRAFKLFLPTLPEQTKIANFLNAVDAKIANLSEEKSLLENYKKGVMQKIFSQELRFKQDDGSDFPEWEMKRLGEVAKFSKGRNISKTDIVEDGRIECIRYGELYTHYKDVIEQIISKTNLSVENLVFSKKNDVIMPASGETQLDIATAACVLKSDIALSGDLNIIRTEQNGIYLAYYINSKMKNKIASLAQGNSVVHLYSKQLSGLFIEFPDQKEQTKIANFLTSIDEKIATVVEALETTKQFKKGLLQQLFV